MSGESLDFSLSTSPSRRDGEPVTILFAASKTRHVTLGVFSGPSQADEARQALDRAATKLERLLDSALDLLL